MQRQLLAFIVIAVAAVLTLLIQAQKTPKDLRKWPAGASPQEIGERVADRLLAIPHSNLGRPGPPPQITYPEVATWYGALTFAQVNGDKALEARLIQRFQPLFGDEAKLIPNPVHVDNTVFAAVPLEIYIQTKEPKYLDPGKSFAEKQWENPTPEGLTPQTRFWIDDMYMVTIVQVQAYRATGDTKYLDRAALEFTDPGKPRVSFIKINDRQFIELYERTEDSQQPSLMHICFETGDIATLRGAYIKEGLEATEIKKFRAGNLLFGMHDPEGQLIEYTRYLPGSLHFSDRGRHLGKQGVSEYLLGASTPVQDLASERAFYISKLGFRATDSGPGNLLLPGESGEGVELFSKSADYKANIVFRVKSLSGTARNLRELNLRRRARNLYTEDPDGTVVVFTAAPK
jgi:hypothetical protein